MGGALALSLVCFATVASSRSGGISGRSGKQGWTCSSCHQGGQTPKVTLEGPTMLDAGALAVYTLSIETDAAITGMNAASTAGALGADVDGGTRSAGEEITHARTLHPDAGIAAYTFSMRAPPFGGKVTLFASGNACNGDDKPTGDESASTELDIEVSGPEKAPEPAPGPSSRAPSFPDSGSSIPDAGEPMPERAPVEVTSCATGWATRSPLPVGPVLAAIAVGTALARGRRRKGG